MAEHIFHCAGCNVRFRVKRYSPRKLYLCPKCRGPLRPESSAIDAPDAQSLASKPDGSPEPVQDELVGQRIAHYQIVKVLGRGGMGAVYQAHNRKLKRTVALKILPPDLAASIPEYVQRFIREAQSQASLIHPNIVTVFHVGKKGDRYFIEMEFLGGGSAADLAEAPIPVDRVVAIIRDAAKGLAAAHERNIVHRDVKPENILLAPDGAAKMGDFGLAKAVDIDSGVTSAGQVIGTPYYMSPEQCHSEAADKRSDIYSLGVTFYHLLAGERPYPSGSAMTIMYHHCYTIPRSPRELRPEIPASVANVCLNAMLKIPENRYQAMGDFLADLEKAAQGKPVGMRAIERVRVAGKVETERPKPSGVPMPAATQPVESARLEDVIDKAAEEARSMRPGRIERRIKEARRLSDSWDHFGRLLKGCRLGESVRNLAGARDAVARDYSNVLPTLEQRTTFGWRVVEACRSGLTEDGARALAEEDFRLLEYHWSGGRELLRDYVAFLEEGRRELMWESRSYFWSRLAHSPVALGVLLIAALSVVAALALHSQAQRSKRRAAPAVEEPGDVSRTASQTEKDTTEEEAKAPFTLTPALWSAFEIPAADTDLHGNRVVTRNGSRFTPETNCPYEIWLNLPAAPTAAQAGEPRMELVLVAEGEFMMGSPLHEQGHAPDEGPVHRVRITRPFYMGKYEVTQAQYETLMRRNPSNFLGSSNPVEQVNWHDAVAFCDKLAERCGVDVRLPLEAEWEYCCRAGTTARFCYGDYPSDKTLGEFAWFDGNSWGKTHPVGQKKPNCWDLRDVHGNVWEWCFDGKRTYTTSAQTDPRGSEAGARVLRGGSWNNRGEYLRSAHRREVATSIRTRLTGFRVVVGCPLAE